MTPLRFSVNKLAEQSGLDRRSVNKLLIDVPSADGCYSLKDFVDGLMARSAIQQARLRKLEAEGELSRMTVDEASGRLVDLDDLVRSLTPVVTEQIRVIESSRLSDSEKDEIRSALAALLRRCTPESKTTKP